MKMILVFDVETTGLFPKKNPTSKNSPYITQLSWVLYNMDTKSIDLEYNKYIRIPDEIEIPAKVTEITGITRELLIETGIDIYDALLDFMIAFHLADMYVAHNLAFDWNMLKMELSRNCPFYEKMLYDPQMQNCYCTMNMSKNILKIERVNSQGVYYKFPTLAELYEFLFKESASNLRLHDAYEDVLCCLKCFIAISSIKNPLCLS
jgi:DNA polymerase III epsilon subunit-like protein